VQASLSLFTYGPLTSDSLGGIGAFYDVRTKGRYSLESPRKTITKLIIGGDPRQFKALGEGIDYWHHKE